MFDARKESSEQLKVPTTVRFRLDRKKGRLKELTPTEKMLCALRKVLTLLSNRDTNGCRYYIDGDSLRLTKEPTVSPAKAGEPRTYQAAGRCMIGVCHPGAHKTTQVIRFSIGYRDTVDDRGLPDVEYLDSTVIETLPRNTPV